MTDESFMRCRGLKRLEGELNTIRLQTNSQASLQIDDWKLPQEFCLHTGSIPHRLLKKMLEYLPVGLRVGVGIMIAHNPLHRSGRAELPHPAPTLGDNAQAHERIRMAHLSWREPTRNVACHATPRQVVTLAATAQDHPPEIAHCSAKGAQCRAIHGHPVITEVAERPAALAPHGIAQISFHQ